MTGNDDGEKPSSSLEGFNECVSRDELHECLDQLKKDTTAAIDAAFKKINIANMFESLDKRVSTLIDRVDALETQDDEYEVLDEKGVRDERATREETLRRRLRRNRHGMGGNNNNHNRDDPFAKVKFSIPSFAGAYDAEAYLDWEMQVEQKFNSHLVPEIHRVRQATSEFKDFALIWWTELARTTGQPNTWDGLKAAMRDRFVPPSYRRDLRKNLQRLEQGNMSVQEYYAELQKGMIRCGVEEDTEDKICRFFGGLRREIQDIVDYKEYTTVNRCFQLACLAEKELQGRQQQKTRSTTSSFTPRTTTSTTGNKSSFSNARTATPPPPPASTRTTTPTTPSTSPTPKPSTQVETPSKGASTSRTAGLQCHRCHGIGHLQRNCPSQRAYIATDDGGYISTSDIEDDHEDNDDSEVFGIADTENYKTIIVQRVLSTQMEQAEKQQRNNLFQTFFIIKNRRARVIIDSGSCNNLVSSDLVKKLALQTRPHKHPYHIQWLNDSGKVKVTQSVRVHFSIGTYTDYADCDVVPIQACSLLLGRPWEYDNDAIHHGRSNKYTFMHNGKKITLLPLTPAEIIQADKDRVANENKDLNVKSEIQQPIKLKGPVLLATKTDIAKLILKMINCAML
jgi:hypothetical protein